MIMIKLLTPLAGKPTGAIIHVIEGVAEHLINAGKAAPVTK